jgi:hypothetical protein
VTRTATIRRNSKKYNAVLTTGTRYVVHNLDNNFVGRVVDLDWARANLLADAKRARATMVDNQDGTFTVSWHSNRWYKITA